MKHTHLLLKSTAHLRAEALELTLVIRDSEASTWWRAKLYWMSAKVRAGSEVANGRDIAETRKVGEERAERAWQAQGI